MLLWFTIAALTVAAVAAMVWPIVSRSRTSDEGLVGAPELEVYRDQLAEIDRDFKRGLIDATEAESARREIARRLLAHPPATHAPNRGEAISTPAAPAGATGVARGRFAAMILAAALPLAAVGLYIGIGAPGQPAAPHAARLQASPDGSPVGELVGRVEARLRERPDDGNGWDVIAPVYMRLSRFNDAADAFLRASRLLGETPDRILGYAEATILGANGYVTPPARVALQRLRQIAPDRPEPRFWLALGREQDGDLEGAASEYGELIATAPADAPWISGVRERLDGVEARRRQASGPGGSPAPVSPAPQPNAPGSDQQAADPRRARGPTAADVKAAEAMTPSERMELIESMVEGLANRLKENGKDLEGWTRLVRAYKTLGREKAALGALADARKALEGNAEAQGTLDTLARSLGLGS